MHLLRPSTWFESEKWLPLKPGDTISRRIQHPVKMRYNPEANPNSFLRSFQWPPHILSPPVSSFPISFTLQAETEDSSRTWCRGRDRNRERMTQRTLHSLRLAWSFNWAKLSTPWPCQTWTQGGHSKSIGGLPVPQSEPIMKKGPVIVVLLLAHILHSASHAISHTQISWPLGIFPFMVSYSLLGPDA